MRSMYRITAGQPFTGKLGPVPFIDGKTETDHEGVVAYCRRHGYTVEPVGEQPAEPGDDQGAPAPFDPGAHNVDEVAAYLAEADDGERARVLAAEADGKGRSTVLGRGD